jgi:hypothetical protein
MYHGGRNLESDYNEILGNKSGQIVHGVGLYLISDIEIAAKFAKGGNKMYRVTFEKGNRADQVVLSNEVCLEWGKRNLPRDKRTQEAFWESYKISVQRKNGEGITAEQFTNLILNYDLLKPSKTADFRRWLVEQGVDYTVSNNYGGGRNTMVVLVNPKKIKKVEIIKWKDVPTDEYDLKINLDENADVIPALYHGTSRESADSLLKNGWEPNKWAQGGQMGQRRYLYVTNTPDNAQWYADEKDNGTIVKLTNIPKEYLRVDPEDGVGKTVDDELNSSHGLPANLVLVKPLPASFFSLD